jgi:dienelactone hydrolase
MTHNNVEARREELYSLLGDLPARNAKITAESVSVQEKNGYSIEKLILELNGIEPVPAYFVKPATASGKPATASGRMPAVLFSHWHGGEYSLGKDEMLRPKEGIPSWAEALAGEGYCALCLDMWCFGERSAAHTELDLFKQALWDGRVLWGMMVYDTLRGLDYLLTRPEVDASRVATLGMSMGSTMSWWVAALDPRVKVCADICCLTDYDALIESGGLGGHGIYYFVPSLLKHFTASQINALIAPRAHIGVAGNLDALTPAAGLDRIDRELKQVYADAGKPENWKLLRYEVEHVETPGMRKEILSFLREKL